MKAQALADFVTECTARDLSVPTEPSSVDEEWAPPRWTLFVDGAPRSMGVEELLVKADSKLVIDQIKGACGVKSDVLRRAENEKADHLSRLATTYYDELPIGICVEVCDQSASLETNISRVECDTKEDWRTPLISYLHEGKLPEDRIESRRIQNRSLKYQLYLGELYRKSWDGPLLTCVATEDIP
ncbi:hypothetical protein LIER_18166 [Lithospermum erythrorhizon]|uniref:Reverse transcriptase n=1 Tax=Lithospermum erythrorhizon TaxID=34254 RepID=A0AAV3QFF0_LITER